MFLDALQVEVASTALQAQESNVPACSHIMQLYLRRWNRLRARYGLDGIPLIIDFNERRQRRRGDEQA